MRFRAPVFGNCAILLATLVAGACSTSEPDIAWEGTVDTLPGGAVRVVNPAVGLWKAGVETPWRLVPELTLGALEGDRPDVFSTISGLAVDADGRILVVDRNTNQLRFFSAQSEHLRTVGRTGEGPGEYTQINGILRLSPDSLLVIDQQGNRYSILTSEDGYERSVRRQLPFFGWLFDGGVDGERVYELSTVEAETERARALVGTHLRDADAALDTVLVPTIPGPTYEGFEVRTERFGTYLGVPFSPRHGHLWASWPAPPMQVRFAVFDSVGRYLGEVGFDGVEQVERLPPIIANDRLHVATQDELGVQRVEVFQN